MLGGMRGHADERALLHAAFLAAPPPLASRMLLPALFLLDAAAGRFQALAPADTALLPGARAARAAAGAAQAGGQPAERLGLLVVGSRWCLAFTPHSDESEVAWHGCFCCSQQAALMQRPPGYATCEASLPAAHLSQEPEFLLLTARDRCCARRGSGAGPMACYACLMRAVCC